MFTLTPNDGAKIPAILQKDGAVFQIPSGASVMAAILPNDHSELLAGPVSVSEVEPGSDWANSAIVAVFTAEQLAEITQHNMDIVMEIQVTDGAALTWYYEGVTQIGFIS
jgi:hypothetical protein